MRIFCPALAARLIGVVAVSLLPVACSDHITAPPQAADTPPAMTAQRLAPEASLRAVLQQTSPQLYPVTVTIFVGQTALGSFPAIVGTAGTDEAIAFFPSWSPTVSVQGGGVIAYANGIPRGQGGIVANVNPGPPNSNPITLSIDFAQFNGFQGNPFVLAAGGVPGGGCIFATATGPNGTSLTVRLDFVPRQR